jgi:hypothetical protein
MPVVHALCGGFSIMDISGMKACKLMRHPWQHDDALRPVNVDLDALEIGARDATDITTSWLDLQTGEVLVLVRGEADARALRGRLRSHKQRYRKVPPFGLAEERALLRDFLSRQTQGSGRVLLMRLVDEPGAFHACLTALKADSVLWRLWECFETQGLRSSLLAWLATMGMKPNLVMSALADK